MKRTADLIAASGEKCADIRYGAGFNAPDEFIFFRHGSCRGIVVSALEYDRACSEADKDVTVLDSRIFSENGCSVTSRILALAGHLGVDSFRVPADFPLLTADKLRQDGLEVTPVDGLFFPEREFKRADEVQEIRRALKIAEDAVRLACDAIGEASVDCRGQLVYRGEIFTSERLRQIIDLHIASHGGVPTGTIAAGALQGAEPHNAGSGVLYAHTPIVMDVFPRLADSGYWGDLTRTVSKGRMPETVRKAYDAVRRARDISKEAIRPGAVPADTHNQAMKILTDAGFATGRTPEGRNFGFFHSLGHGVGLEIHEQPRLSPSNTQPLQGGEVITVEPGLYYPEWGGIRLEDMVYVTGDGAECLTAIETVPVIP